MLNSPHPSAPAIQRRRRFLASLLALPGVFCLASSAFAATLTVTNANDGGAGSLRGTLAAAAAGDTITFDAGAFPPSGSTMITLATGQLAISQNLTVQGPGAGAVTVSGGQGASRVFSVAAGITAGLSGLTIANGGAGSQFGGAISNGGTLTLTKCSLGNNSAYFGGGIYNTGTLTVTGCTLTGNNGVSGGAIYSSGGTLTLTNSTLSGNTASDGNGGGNGGGIDSSTATVTLTGCTLSGNSAGSGGGISRIGGSMTVTNCTFSGNATLSGGFGAGIYNTGSGGSGLVLTNCTLAGNTASQAGKGGGIYNTAGAIIQSCILNGNTALGGGPDVFGTITSGGSNMIGDPNGVAYGFTGPHDQVYVNPKFDPNGLKNNGGPTQTIALLAGSPAINSDYNGLTTTDQRGFARPQNTHADIGAFELQSQAHILWHSPDGRATVWFVNPDGSFGTSRAYGPYVDSAGIWQAVALATGPDGVSRLLWHSPDGRATIWHVYPDGRFDTSQAYGPYVDSAGIWQAVAVSVGPDDVAHILWHSPDGRATLWFVNPDGSFGSSQAYGPYVDSAGIWQAVALATGPDGVSRLLWHSPDGRATIWHVYSDGRFDTSQAYGPYVDSAGIWQAVADSAGP